MTLIDFMIGLALNAAEALVAGVLDCDGRLSTLELSRRSIGNWQGTASAGDSKRCNCRRLELEDVRTTDEGPLPGCQRSTDSGSVRKA